MIEGKPMKKKNNPDSGYATPTKGSSLNEAFIY